MNVCCCEFSYCNGSIQGRDLLRQNSKPLLFVKIFLEDNELYHWLPAPLLYKLFYGETPFFSPFTRRLSVEIAVFFLLFPLM